MLIAISNPTECARHRLPRLHKAHTHTQTQTYARIQLYLPSIRRRRFPARKTLSRTSMWCRVSANSRRPTGACPRSADRRTKIPGRVGWSKNHLDCGVMRRMLVMFIEPRRTPIRMAVRRRCLCNRTRLVSQSVSYSNSNVHAQMCVGFFSVHACQRIYSLHLSIQYNRSGWLMRFTRARANAAHATCRWLCNAV